MTEEIVEIHMKIILQFIVQRGKQDDTWIKFKVTLF